MARSGEVFCLAPEFVERLWGGGKLLDFFPSRAPASLGSRRVGEAWVLTGFQQNYSVATNPPHKGRSLRELMKEGKEDLLGKSVYRRFGDECFPLLVKFIDAKERLSVQAHPNDEVARRLAGEPNGKTEMWFVMSASPGARVYYGFNRDMTQDLLQQHIRNGSLESALNAIPVSAGDVFYIPAGTIHAIGEGVFLAEVQQASDLTYRLFDWGRVEPATGKPRQLHLDEAFQVLDYRRSNYKPRNAFRLKKAMPANQPGALELVRSPYFETSFLFSSGKETLRRDYGGVDSFVALMALDGEVEVAASGELVAMRRGDLVLLSAGVSAALYTPSSEGFQLLEVVVPSN